MKKKWNLILGVVLLAGVLASAVFAYRLLSKSGVGTTAVSGVSDSASTATSSIGTSAGQTAPDITVTDVAGKKLSLSSLRGKPVVLNFWASWCPPCKAEMPDYQSLYEKYGENAAFVMVDGVGLRGETVEAGKAFLSQNHYTFPAYFDTDGSAVKTYGIDSIPRSYYIDKNGVIRAYANAMMGKDEMESAIQKIL